MKNLTKKIRSTNYPWTSLFLLTFFAVHLYLISEWVFLITKPSFINFVIFLKKMEVLFFTASIFTGFCFALLAFIYLVSENPIWKEKKRWFLIIGSLIPNTIFSCLVLLLIDNFTYTVFKFGVVKSDGITRGLYLLLFLIIVMFLFLKINAFLTEVSPNEIRARKQKNILTILIAYTIITSFVFYNGNISGTDISIKENANSTRYPNILLITADGVNANHMSVYGYDLDTTPRIRELAQTSLVAENAFTNSGSTTGSIISIYTSKLPTQTRVLYPPDILKNEDSLQHLPGILSGLGYSTFQFTHPLYIDAFDQNLLNGFDFVNGRSLLQSYVFRKLSEKIHTDNAYFIYEISHRIVDRLRHIFFIKKMSDQGDLIEGKKDLFDDQQKIEEIIKIVSNEEYPVFIHIHWMGTHGPKFFPQNQIFSKGHDVGVQEEWGNVFYDDSILEFDKGIGTIIDELANLGILENTIIIIGSDHGQRWVTTEKIPLLIHFPDGQYAGVRNSNIQNLDISPTILDYLNIEKPSWMFGNSFLQKEIDTQLIIGTGVDVGLTTEKEALELARVKPPFYQFGYISAIYCNYWYKLNLLTFSFESGIITGHRSSCNLEIPEGNVVLGWMIERLKEDGFDTLNISETLIK